VHPIKLRYVLFLVIWLPVSAFAQLKKSGLAHQAPDKSSVLKHARKQAGEPLSLPFWDDFSRSTGHPDDSLWIINHTVFVNDGQAINPPSLNVATFDGLDENGLPYSTISEETGYRDTLESQFINLATVLPAHKNSIYLSFFYQAGGNSEIPEPGDFLKLEFKSTEGWEEIYRFKVKANSDPALFYDTAIQIQQAVAGSIPNYFHNEFQFRFTSFGKLSGAYDGWHLDYVYLNRRVNDNEEVVNPSYDINEGDKNTNISDRAISTPFTSILRNGYYAMPYSHFLLNATDNLNPLSTIQFFNLIDAAFPQSARYSSSAKITNFNNSGVPTIIFNGPVVTDANFGFALPSRQYATRLIDVLPDASIFVPADSSKIFIKLGANIGDMKDTVDYFSRYDPIDFRSNDTTSHTFTLSNYYAYDDGIAEYAMQQVAQGNQFAYRFVMDEDIEQDIINGAFIYFPFAAGKVPPDMQIFIFRDKGGKPDSAWVHRQTIPVTRTANNLFTEINFSQGVIVQDTFYIGYLETETGGPERIRIGLDASHNTGNQIYTRNTVYHEWLQNDLLEGSVMIRPRFGYAPVVSGIEDNPNPVSIYPNPNKGEFYMKGRVDNLQVIALTGQSISFRVEQMQDTKKVMLQGTAPGIYIVRYQSGSKIYTHKILVRE
jgi:hypothetical protein